jgi:hypothetical protein
MVSNSGSADAGEDFKLMANGNRMPLGNHNSEKRTESARRAILEKDNAQVDPTALSEKTDTSG